jgi:hypothetical protein
MFWFISWVSSSSWFHNRHFATMVWKWTWAKELASSLSDLVWLNVPLVMYVPKFTHWPVSYLFYQHTQLKTSLFFSFLVAQGFKLRPSRLLKKTSLFSLISFTLPRFDISFYHFSSRTLFWILLCVVSQKVHFKLEIANSVFSGD